MSERVQYIDPEVHSQRKSEFRLHGKCYKNNLKLALNMNAADGQFNDMVGAYGMIKHIRLMSGGVEMDSCRFANYYMAWKNVNNSNEENRNRRYKLAQNDLGFELTNQLFVAGQGSLPQTATSTASSKQAAILSLMEVLPLLKEIMFLNTDLIPSLKIIIEYNTDLQLIKKTTTDAGTISAPILIAEEILDQSVISASQKIKGAVWESPETDGFILPAGTPGTVQKVVQRVNGFDNKMVSKMVMMKHLFPVSANFNGANALGFGPYASQVQHKEEVNFIVNSKPIFPRNIKERAEKACHLISAWGKVNVLPYANQSSIGNNKNGTTLSVGARIGIPFPANTAAAPHPAQKVGQQDYTGVALNTKINQLEISYQRLPLTDGATPKRQTDSLEFRIIAMVQKAISFSGGPPSVSYV